MPNYTENYNLKKPLPEEFYNIEDHNSNMDIIDEELKKRANLDATGKVPKDQIPELDYVKSEKVNVAGGVAGLDDTGKLPAAIFPENVGGGGSGKRTTRFTVGSSQYGWTASDCDYLCDGTADDVEINAAIQALRSTGGEVILLDGLYNLNSAILINKDNVTLCGNGANTKIVRAFNDDEYDDQQGLVVIKNSFCTIRNLYFDCVKGTFTSNNAINLYSGDNCIIADNTVVNSSCDGIYMKGNYHTIDNNVITGCNGNGLYVYSGNKYTVTNNKITGCTVYGMYLYNVKDSVISNNVCIENTDCGIKVYWCDRCTFTGNVLNNNNQCGLYLTRGEGNVISGNTFIANKFYGVYLNSYSSETVVMSNVFADNTTGEVKDGGTNNTIHLPSHGHSADDITSGTLPVGRGGTGVTSIEALASLLGIGSGSGGSGDGSIEVKNYDGDGSGSKSITFTRTMRAVIIFQLTGQYTDTAFTICSAASNSTRIHVVGANSHSRETTVNWNTARTILTITGSSQAGSSYGYCMNDSNSKYIAIGI